LCRECHGFCSEVLKKMRQGCDEDEDDEVLVSWLVVVNVSLHVVDSFGCFLSFISGFNLNFCFNFGVM